MWHDGQHWRAAIDTTDFHPETETANGAAPGAAGAPGPDANGPAAAAARKGALASFKPLTNFREERQYGTFSEVDDCNFGVSHAVLCCALGFYLCAVLCREPFGASSGMKRLE